MFFYMPYLEEAMNNKVPYISVSGIKKVFGKVIANNNVNLEVFG